MTAGLETFAKVRALHDRTDNPGEKASAAARMKTLARKAGMTVEQAVSKLDAPKPTAPRNFFEDLFNSPEFRAQDAERQRKRAERRAAALVEHGTEDAVWAQSPWEIALELACRPVVVRKPIIGGETDTLMGWQGGRLSGMPPEVRNVVSSAYLLPTTVYEAWTELCAWEKLTDYRCAFWPDYSPDVRLLARIAILENLLDTLPARGMRDLRTRLDWMQYVLDRGFSRDACEDQDCLTALRADIERMGQRLREEGQSNSGSAAPVQSGHPGGGHDPIPPSGVQSGQEGYARSADPSLTPCRATVENSAEGGPHTGHPRRTNADKRRDVLALLDQGLTDREIARRAGVSPTTVGTIRRTQP